MKLEIMIMSGVEDGHTMTLDSDAREGQLQADSWTITIGRNEDRDICLRRDSFISREHAQIHWRDNQWWLEDDGKSKNGTYIEQGEEDIRVEGTVSLNPNQLFRIGRTWLRIESIE